mgnify:FL=1
MMRGSRVTTSPKVARSESATGPIRSASSLAPDISARSELVASATMIVGGQRWF